ncbi:MAG: DnaJ domain-containing protein [Chloroflexota bacterium]|nr:DnaJ domain-containing protein [Chloroflexota bacterium]
MPRPPERATDADEGAHAPSTRQQQIVQVVTSIEPIEEDNGVDGLESDATEPTTALATVGPHVDPDPGLYAVLGLDPSVSDAEIQTAYRRRAARLQGGGGRDQALLRQLNVAYEVLGTRVRREEYDRSRLAQLVAPGAPTPIQAGAKAPVRITRRRRPRHAVQPSYAGFSYVLVVLFVVGLAAAIGALIILPRVSFNLSALNALQSVLPLPSSSRRAVDVTVTPAATAAPTATLQPGAAQRFAGSSASVSNPNPAQSTVENVLIKIRYDGQPAANADVWAIATYSTTQERWPATGTQKTDASGAATISFNIGRAVPEHPVPVQVFAQVGDQQFSWSTTFTPH